MHTYVINFDNRKDTRNIIFHIPPFFKIFNLILKVSHPLIFLRNNFKMFFHHLYFVGHLFDFIKTFLFYIIEFFLLFQNSSLKWSGITFHLSPLTHFCFKTDNFIFQLVIIRFILGKFFIQNCDIVSSSL